MENERRTKNKSIDFPASSFSPLFSHIYFRYLKNEDKMRKGMRDPQTR